MRAALLTLFLLVIPFVGWTKPPSLIARVLYLRTAKSASWSEVFNSIERAEFEDYLRLRFQKFDYSSHMAIAFEICYHFEKHYGEPPFAWTDMPAGTEKEFRDRYVWIVEEAPSGLNPFMGDSTYFQSINLRRSMASNDPVQIQAIVEYFKGLQLFVGPINQLLYVAICNPEKSYEIAHQVLSQSPKFDCHGTINTYLSLAVALEKLGGYEATDNYEAHCNPQSWFYYEYLINRERDMAREVASEIDYRGEELTPHFRVRELASYLRMFFFWRSREVAQDQDGP